MRAILLRCLWVLLFTMPSYATAGGLPPATSTQLIDYHDSGQYYQDLSAVIKEATYYLQFRLTHNARTRHPRKLAIVFDIDETLVSNFDVLRSHQFDPTFVNKPLAASTALAHTLALYNFARSHGVAILLITTRPASCRDLTIAQLHQLGYHAWAALRMVSAANAPLHFQTFVSERQQLLAAGYDIILNLGTQPVTLRGGLSDMTLALPNPFYRLG